MSTSTFLCVFSIFVIALYSEVRIQKQGLHTIHVKGFRDRISAMNMM